MRIIGLILTLLGGAIMAVSAVQYHRLLEKLKVENPHPTVSYRLVKGLARFTFLFFLVGYAVGFFDILTRNVESVYYFICAVFFIGALFIFVLVKNQIFMTVALEEKNQALKGVLGQIEEHNQILQSEVDRSIQDFVRQDKMLHAVNDAAFILLSSNVEEFEDALWKCMGMLGESVSVDRVYVWKNHYKGERLYTSQLYEWSEGAEPQQGKEIAEDILLDDISNWRDKLSRGQSINGLVRDLSQAEQDQLTPQGIISVLVVPVFLQEEFWGFFGFDDCHRERVFSESEEAIVRSGSLIFANAMLRNEMTMRLMEAREEAIAGTKAKSDFLANISHEIRTPINAITGMVAIAKGTEDKERVRDCLHKIDNASHQLLGLINNVLDMSKIEANRFELAQEPFELAATINNIVSIIGVNSAEKQQRLLVDIGEDVPEIVVGDNMRLSQVLLNLLSNSVKFTPERGEIRLSMQLITVQEGRCHLKVVVQDNGIGMTPEQLSRLFGKFEQADRNTAGRYGGTGLGLAISKSIVELMDGSIVTESVPGQGSCFTVWLWLEQGRRDMLTPQAGGSEIKYDFSGRTALLAEDIQINQEIVVALLQDTGLTIECAEDGQAALEMFQAEPEKYSIIYMDVHMPVMDGYTATRNLRALDVPNAKKVPIIAMTANAFAEDVENCLKAGMNDHISKPIDGGILLKKTEKYLLDHI